MGTVIEFPKTSIKPRSVELGFDPVSLRRWLLQMPGVREADPAKLTAGLPRGEILRRLRQQFPDHADERLNWYADRLMRINQLLAEATHR